jgi:hypothetical protein
MNQKLLAFCLGDGTVNKRYRLDIRHCKQQNEYLKWKHSFISSICRCSNIKTGIQNGFEYTSFYTQENFEDLKLIRQNLYEKYNKKYFSKEIVDKMDLFCFAILYCDDGSLSAKKNNGKITAYDLTISICGEKEECENLIAKLKTFGLSFTLKRNKGKFSIRCGTQSARKFISLIKSLIPDFQCFKQTKFKELVTDKSFIYSKFKNKLPIQK